MKKAVLIPICSGIITLLFLKYINVSDIVICKIDFVLNAIITCVVTLAGFILTSVSIIIGMSGSSIMKKIRDNGGLPELIIRYTTTMVLSLIIIVIFIFIGATIKDNNIVCQQSIIIGSGSIIAYLLSLISTCYYLLKIISQIPNDNIVEESEQPSVPNGEFR